MQRRLRRFPKDEFARRGDEIYARDIRAQYESSRYGEFVAIDIESGDFEIGPDETIISNLLTRRQPDAQIWLRRVGIPYAHRIGGASAKVCWVFVPSGQRIARDFGGVASG